MSDRANTVATVLIEHFSETAYAVALEQARLAIETGDGTPDDWIAAANRIAETRGLPARFILSQL